MLPASFSDRVEKEKLTLTLMGGTDNDIFIMIISVTVVLLLLVTFIISFLFIYKNRQMRHRLEIESVKEKYSREILTAQLEIKEETLKNISEEIHDNLGQVLSLAVLNLSAIELHDTTRAANKIEDVTRLVEKVVGDLRNLSKTLDAENITRLELVTIIKSELEQLERTGLYQTLFKTSGEEKKIDNQRKIVLYRIIQESLTNIIKHAKARLVTVILDFTDSHVYLEIRDNGRGFDASETTPGTIYKNGAGLNNMKKRAHLIGGTFDIRSLRETGTTISMNIPLIYST